MRIALVTEIPAPFRIPLFNALAGRPDVELRVLFLAAADPRRPHYGQHEEELDFDRRVLRGVELRRGSRWLVLSRGTVGELERFRPDLVLIGGWNQPAFWTALLWARVRRRPAVVWIESTAADLRGVSSAARLAKRAFVRACAGALVPGRAAAAYARALGFRDERIGSAPNSVDLDVFGRRVEELRADRERLRAGLGLTRPTALYVGRLDPEKGLDVLLRAAAGLHADVVLVGDGCCSTRLRAEAPGNVRFAGALDRNELPAWYAAADMFVLPSLSEPWGMVLNEAAAAGLPLVATDAAGAAFELVDEGVNGFRVPAGDVPALRTALETLLADDELRAAAGVRSRELANAMSPDTWAEGVTALARRLGL